MPKKPYIHTGDGYMGRGDIAQGGSSRNIRTVGIGLAGYIGRLTDAPHPGRRYRVRGIQYALDALKVFYSE